MEEFEDEFFDDEFMEDHYFDDQDELQMAEVDFRVEQCLSILREICPITQINLGWQSKSGDGDDTQIYHKGFGDTHARKGHAEHLIQRIKESWYL